MLPRTYPTNTDLELVVFQVSPTGRVKWVDYIPVKGVTPGANHVRTYENDGAMAVEELASSSGLTAWVDYLPVVIVTDSDATRWRSDNDGWIPVDLAGLIGGGGGGSDAILLETGDTLVTEAGDVLIIE